MGWKQEMFHPSWSEYYSTSGFEVRLSWKERSKTLIPRKLENKDPQFFLLEEISTNGCVTYLKHNSSPLFTPRCFKVKARSSVIFKWVTMLHVWLEEYQWTVISSLFLMKSFVACTWNFPIILASVVALLLCSDVTRFYSNHNQQIKATVGLKSKVLQSRAAWISLHATWIALCRNLCRNHNYCVQQESYSDSVLLIRW